MSLLVLSALMLFKASAALAQSGDPPWRAFPGSPNPLATGYYVVDSTIMLHCRGVPNYFFGRYELPDFYLDSYLPPVPGVSSHDCYYFFDPRTISSIPPGWIQRINSMAGPIPSVFTYNFYAGNYDSVYIGSNGYIRFSPVCTGCDHGI